jgi:hypothetical protein
MGGSILASVVVVLIAVLLSVILLPRVRRIEVPLSLHSFVRVVYRAACSHTHPGKQVRCISPARGNAHARLKGGRRHCFTLHHALV